MIMGARAGDFTGTISPVKGSAVLALSPSALHRKVAM